MINKDIIIIISVVLIKPRNKLISINEWLIKNSVCSTSCCCCNLWYDIEDAAASVDSTAAVSSAAATVDNLNVIMETVKMKLKQKH